MTPPKVFICYARTDNESDNPREKWLDRVRKHLKPYQQRREIEVFADVDIHKGDLWRVEILGQLREARIVVILISEDLVASDFVRQYEMPLILDRQSKDELTIVPVVLNSCDYSELYFRFPHPDDGPHETLLSVFQSAGSPSQTLIEMTPAEQGRTLHGLARAVRRKAAEWNKRLSGGDSSSLTSISPASATPPLPAPPVIPTAAVPPPPANPVRPPLDMPVAPLLKPDPREFVNSLGMRFVPVPGTKVWFSIWQTRVRDYAEYAKATPQIDASWKDPLFQGVPVTPGPLYPVVNVSWHDAVAFCQWLTRKELAEGKLIPGGCYRLPTDLEWSAAVGLTGESGRTPRDRDRKIRDVYPWGRQQIPVDNRGKPLANVADESAKARFPSWDVISGYTDGFPTTSPVGSFPPLANALFDTAGNVWEWCDDLYQPSGTARVLRGGSWFSSSPELLLSSSRNGDGPGARGAYYGFRCVVEMGGAAR